MAFQATITFSGVCGVVPQVNPAPPPAPPAPPSPPAPGAFCILLPNAWEKDPAVAAKRHSKADGVSQLRRHAPFVQFTTKPPDTTNVRQDLEGLWYLNNHKLIITPTYDTGVSRPASWGDITNLSSYEHVASVANQGLLSVANAVLTPNPALVAGQIFLRNGSLAAVRGNVEWVFDSYLNDGKIVKKVLSHKVIVDLGTVLSLVVDLQDFSGVSIKKYTFSNGPALVAVVNICDENPLQWGMPIAVETMPDDDDFRWHYELVDDPAAIQSTLKGLRCPIPRVVPVPSNGNGLNCLPIRFSQVSFPIQ